MPLAPPNREPATTNIPHTDWFLSGKFPLRSGGDSTTIDPHWSSRIPDKHPITCFLYSGLSIRPRQGHMFCASPNPQNAGRYFHLPS